MRNANSPLKPTSNEYVQYSRRGVKFRERANAFIRKTYSAAHITSLVCSWSIDPTSIYTKYWVNSFIFSLCLSTIQNRLADACDNAITYSPAVGKSSVRKNIFVFSIYFMRTPQRTSRLSGKFWFHSANASSLSFVAFLRIIGKHYASMHLMGLCTDLIQFYLLLNNLFNIAVDFPILRTGWGGRGCFLYRQ